MTPETDLLRRAAARVREVAGACLDENNGLDEESWYRVEDATDPDAIRTKWKSFAEFNLDDAAHIALWDPSVALAVADWLEYEAETIGRWDEGTPGRRTRALAVARLILEETTSAPLVREDSHGSWLEERWGGEE